MSQAQSGSPAGGPDKGQPPKTGLKVLQLWGVLLLAAAAVVGVTTAVEYRPAPGKPTVVTTALAAAGLLALIVGSFVRWRFTVTRRKRR